MRAARELTELRQYFAIKTDLAAAIRATASDDIDFHLTELSVMGLYTTSDRLRRACRAAIASFALPIAAIHA